MLLGTEVNLGPRDIVLDGDPAPPKGAQPPIFGPCLLWSNGWMINIPLGMGAGLSPCNIVLDGDPTSPKRGSAPPILACLLWPNGSMDQDAT